MLYEYRVVIVFQLTVARLLVCSVGKLPTLCLQTEDVGRPGGDKRAVYLSLQGGSSGIIWDLHDHDSLRVCLEQSRDM